MVGDKRWGFYDVILAQVNQVEYWPCGDGFFHRRMPMSIWNESVIFLTAQATWINLGLRWCEEAPFSQCLWMYTHKWYFPKLLMEQSWTWPRGQQTLNDVFGRTRQAMRQEFLGGGKERKWSQECICRKVRCWFKATVFNDCGGQSFWSPCCSHLWDSR